ncbi:hypothetical protein [Sphingobium sp.]|uniref:hypothetical protein n=1 Tax=Sphingobium sp. TaxID=1912891 RepID=UPI0028BE3556|nr:hypothetical protein [Sphingobium sp.]
MKKEPRIPIFIGRLLGISKKVNYPIAVIEIHYNKVNVLLEVPPEKLALRLAVTPDECRELARHLELVAAEIESMGRMTH